ncbi:NADP-dependent oxidoreductase domain-containing protein [Salinisphaera dokdonensis CL-ES53]|uniref:NADP-dependent oxidoreductase domain-containing protein n=1 Tax=Salinisphaera dokdonensis CL-ES53 TaxID=1304272 RepID=A0ABV2B402_9GAMM
MSGSDSILDKSISRRRVLGYGAAGAGLAMLPWQAALAAKMDAEAGSKAMIKRAIPGTDEMIPAMGMGSSGSYERLSSSSAEELRTVMKEFVAMGGTLVDTSPSYGNAETNIGEIARDTDVRDQLFMATKVRKTSREATLDQFRSSIDALGEPIDLLQIHNFIGLENQWATLKQLKEEGRVRYIGITHYLTSAFDELEHQMATKEMDFVQFNYSVMTPDAEERLLPMAADHGIAVLVNRAFNDGRIFGATKGKQLPEYAKDFDCFSWAQFALKYVLANETVTAAIPATSDPEHLRDNMHAGYGKLPDAAQRKRMRETIASL